MTCVATNLDWYIPCMRWIRGGISGRIFGSGKILGVGWVCGRGFYGCIFVKGVLLGYFGGIFLGRLMGVN